MLSVWGVEIFCIKNIFSSTPRPHPRSNNDWSLKCHEPLKIFSHNQTFATALITLAKKVLGLDFSFGSCTFSKQGSWTTIQENGSSLLYDVTQGFILARNKQKQREIAFFFCRMPDLCIPYGCNIKVTLKMADLYKEYPFLTIIARNE